MASKTVNKMLAYSVPPGYQRQKPVRRPKLGLWQGVIDAILEDDKQRLPKQRHTAKRIFERLRAEHRYMGYRKRGHEGEVTVHFGWTRAPGVAPLVSG